MIKQEIVSIYLKAITSMEEDNRADSTSIDIFENLQGTCFIYIFISM